jgi:hypothetical protein
VDGTELAFSICGLGAPAGEFNVAESGAE